MPGEAVPVPPFATGNIPVTPVVNGNPVRLVAVMLVGVPNTAPLGIVTVPVKVGEAIGAFNASLPFSFWIACKILSVEATVPEPLVYPVSTLPITDEFKSVGL